MLIFIAALFTTAKRWKRLKCPLTNKWINKMHYYSGLENEQNSDACYNMDGPLRHVKWNCLICVRVWLISLNMS